MKTSGIEDILPLSPLQEGLLFHALSGDDDTDVYNTQLVLTVEGPLDEERMRTAAAALLRRHANLRTAFRQRANGHPLQVVHRDVPLPWTRTDLSAQAGPERQQALDALLDADRARRFDLAAAPALRFTLVRLGAEQHTLVLTNHHILIDGWSAPVLQRELFTLYADHGDPAALPRSPPTAPIWPGLQSRTAGPPTPRGSARWRVWPGRPWSRHPIPSGPRSCPSTAPPSCPPG